MKATNGIWIESYKAERDADTALIRELVDALWNVAKTSNAEYNYYKHHNLIARANERLKGVGE